MGRYVRGVNRRNYLAAVAASIGFSGCSALATTGPESDTDESMLTVTAPTVTQGETATITVEAQAVNQLWFSAVPEFNVVAYDDAEFSPTPSVVFQREPPTWVWSSPETVSGTVPMRVPETTPSGTYQYSITMQPRDDEKEVTETVTITIQE